MDKLAVLRSFIERTPTDPFPRYGLAMELRRQGQSDEARAAFAQLMSDFPSYVPTYLMAGQHLLAIGAAPEALEVFRAGIAAARAAGDNHAAAELEQALADATEE